MRIWTCGFELNSLNSSWEISDSDGDAEIVSSPVNELGKYSLKCTAEGTYHVSAVTYQFTRYSPIFFFRTYIYIAKDPDQEDAIINILDSQMRPYIQVLLTPVDRSISLYNERQNRYIGSNSSALLKNIWYRVEVGINATDPKNTIVTLFLNGIQISQEIVSLNLSFGFDLPNATPLQTIAIGIGLLGAEAYFPTLLTQGIIYFDDCAINDNTTTDQNSYPGPGHVTHYLPNSMGDTNQFTIHSGGGAGSNNNYTRVNTIPFDDTTYNADTIINHTDEFSIETNELESDDIITVASVGIRFAGKLP